MNRPKFTVGMYYINLHFTHYALPWRVKWGLELFSGLVSSGTFMDTLNSVQGDLNEEE